MSRDLQLKVRLTQQEMKKLELSAKSCMIYEKTSKESSRHHLVIGLHPTAKASDALCEDIVRLQAKLNEYEYF